MRGMAAPPTHPPIASVQVPSELLDALGLGAWSYDLETTSSWLGPGAAALYGLPSGPDGWRGPSEEVASRVDPADRALSAMASGVRREEGDRVFLSSKPFRLLAQPGRWFRLSAVRRDQETVVRGVLLDVTELVRHKEEVAALRETARQNLQLASAEAFAAPLAHDIGNLLTPVLGTLELLGDDDVVQDWRRKLLDDAVVAGAAVVPLLRSLVGMVREPVRGRSCQLGPVLAAAEGTLTRVAPVGVSVEVVCHDPGEAVAIGEGELLQVLFNVVRNAFDSLEATGGTVRVTSERGEAGLVLRIDDDGPGFPEAMLEDGGPMRTTKVDGTGLGLWMVRSVVESCGGGFRFGNGEQGAWVELLLPLGTWRSPGRGAASVTGDGRLVLLVGTEELLCHWTRSALEHLGFRVHHALSWVSARVIQTQEEAVLIIILPGAADESLDLGIPALGIAGVTAHGGLPMPFTLSDLVEGVAGALEG